jgi:inorganic pyrophosphatase
MGADLFGSFAESTCAALVVLSQSPTALNYGAMFYPLIISALGICVSFVTSFFATNFMVVD